MENIIHAEKIYSSKLTKKFDIMVKTIGEAIALFQRLGCDIMSMNMDKNITTEHYVNHKFREAPIIVPYCSVTNNVDWFMSNGDKYVTTADGVRCKVEHWEEKHICELDSKIKELYGIDAWSFICRWFKASNGHMDSMHFLIIKLKKDE